MNLHRYLLTAVAVGLLLAATVTSPAQAAVDTGACTGEKAAAVGVTIGRGYSLQLYYCPVSEHHTGRSEMA